LSSLASVFVGQNHVWLNKSDTIDVNNAEETMMRFPILFITLLFLLTGCEKEAGEGGTSSITGKVWVLDYNSEYTEINATYYAQKEDVFIIYGDEVVYGNTFETNYDGTYRFDHLRKGKYRIYVYSEDTTGLVPGGVFPVIRDVEITENKQDLVLDNLVIVK
jgi:hypothetical protein